MTPLTVEELQQILDKTGLTKNAIEKKFGMGNGSIGKFLIGKLNSLPDKYVTKIRKLEKEVESNKQKISITEEDLKRNNDLEINTTVNVGNDEAFDKIQEILDNYKPDPNQEWFNDTGERPIDEADVPFIEEPLDKKLCLIPEVKYLDERDNPLINSARGRDESGVNEDEATLEIVEQKGTVSVNNFAEEPEVGEVDMNEYEKIEADSDKFVGEVMNGEEISLNVDVLPKMNINDLDFGNIQLVTKKKQVKRPLMDIADLL